MANLRLYGQIWNFMANMAKFLRNPPMVPLPLHYTIDYLI